MKDTEFWVVSRKERLDDDGRVSHVIETNTGIVEELRDHANSGGRVSAFGISDEALELGSVCSHGSFFASQVTRDLYELVPFSEHDAVPAGNLSRDDAPDEICTYCWKRIYDREEARSDSNEPEVDYHEDDGFRFRFKWRGDPRNVWADIVVGYNTTFKSLSATLKSQFRFDTIAHVQMWGLKEEYFDSRAAVLDLDRFEQSGGAPTELGDNDQHRHNMADTTVGDFLTHYNISDGDRICYAWDLATPTGIYGILKETGVDADPETVTIQTSEGNIPFESLR